MTKIEMFKILLMQSYSVGQINRKQFSNSIWKNFLHGKLTFCHWNKGEEMTPTLEGNGGTLLVRKIPFPHPT